MSALRRKRPGVRGRSGRSASSEGGAPAPSSAPDLRPFIYGTLDLTFAGGYAFLLSSVVPSEHAGTSALLWGLVALMAAMGCAMYSRRPAAWWFCAAGCSAYLVATVLLLAVLLHSAGFLNGVYGAFGQGAAVGALLVAALSIELVGLLPALQLKYLRTRAGRRSFGRELAA